MRQIIDFRSDNLARPTDEMMRAMCEAARKPRRYGFREDEDQQELESLAAELLGKEEALFFPTCTMANQVALRLHCEPGSFVLAERMSHLCGVEASSTADSGVAIHTFDGRRGHPTPQHVTAALGLQRPETQLPIRLVWVENTHNAAGGTVMPQGDFVEVLRIAEAHGVPVHVDGSRIWNAAAAQGVPPAQLVRSAATVAVSLNKALRAPLGALLAGSKELIAKALRLRNILGGGWRPVGIAAAAGSVALRSQRQRIIDDHRRAARLAAGLSAIGTLSLQDGGIETNIVVVNPRVLKGSRTDLISALHINGVLVGPHGVNGLRLVTHADIDDASIDTAIEVFGNIAGNLS